MDFLSKIQDQSNIFDDIIVGVIDNDMKKSGNYICGYLVSNVKKLSVLSFDLIVVASSGIEEISLQLKERFSIVSEKIISDKDYRRKKISEYQFKRNYAKKLEISSNACSGFSRDSVVVYTAIIGDYDDLHNPEYVNPNWKYICFTDNKYLKSDIWDVCYVKNEDKLDTPSFVRKFKICPHKFFSEFNTSIWMDANLCIKKDLAILMENYQRYADILFFPHPERICVYDEGAACVFWKRDNKKKILTQLKRYLEDEYPYDNGLLYGGFIIRNHNKIDVTETMEMWWHEVLNESKRDQISLPYVLWKTKLPYDLVDLNYVNNEWFHFFAHKA